MTEERIKQAAETIHSTNNRIITEGILRTIAAEARKEGIEEAYRAGYEEAAGNEEYLENCLYEYLKEQV